jgi:hypothetical protein
MRRLVSAALIGMLAVGALAATAAGAIASEPSSYAIYAAGYGNDAAQIQWCETTYRSYSPETDLWRDYQGYVHRCEGPY